MKFIIAILFLIYQSLYANGTDCYLNVRHYGAIGDGISDDTQFFQVIFDSLSKCGGGTIIIPSGKYLLTKTLHVTGSNIYIEGDKWFPTILLHYGNQGETTMQFGNILSSLNNISIKNIVIKCNSKPDPLRDKEQAGGIVVMNATNIIVDNIIIDSSYIYGIWFWNVTNGFIINNTIVGVNYDGIAIQHCKNIIIDNNKLLYNKYDGIIVSNNGHNVSQQSKNKNDSTNKIICRNNIIQTNAVGIEILQSSVYLFDNIINGSTKYGIGGMGGCYDSQIINNNIICESGYGVLITGSGDGPKQISSNWNIISNKISGSTSEGIGLHFGGNHIICRNNVKQSGIGLLIYNSSKNIVCQNIIDNTKYSGIKLINTFDTNIYENTIQDVSMGSIKKYYAIEIDSLSKGNKIRMNTINDSKHSLKQEIYTPLGLHNKNEIEH